MQGGFFERGGLMPRVLVPFVLVVTLLSVAYSNTFQAPFTFDDYPNIVRNKSLQIEKISSDELMTVVQTGSSENRWLPNISFALNYHYGGEGEVWGFHLVNLVIHIAAALVFFALASTTLGLPVFENRYVRSREIALLAALIWALHPLQTNAVTYIVQRMTSMAALFYFASLLFYVQGRLRVKTSHSVLFFAASLISGGLAVICKENAVMLPVMIVGYEFFLLSSAAWNRNWRKGFVFVGLAICVVLVFAWLYLGDNLISAILSGYALREFTLAERLLTESRVVFLYLGLMLLPLPSRLNFSHDIELSLGFFSPPQTALSVFGLLGIVVLAVYLFRRDRLISFAIFWFLGNLLIESTVVPLELIFEHRLYLPSAFLFLSVVAAGYRFGPGKLLVKRMVVIALVLACTFFTWERNKVWANAETFWLDVVTKSPGIRRGHQNLGNVFFLDGQIEKAEKIFLRALEVGRVRNKREKPGSLAAINHANIHAVLASIYWKTGRWQESFASAEQALRINPDNISARITKGICYEKYGQSENAVAMFVEANLLGEESVDLFNNWGMSCFSLGRVDEAITLFKRALAIDDKHAEGHYNLGIAYGSKGMREEARREMMLAMQLQQQQK